MFGDKQTDALLDNSFVRDFQGVAQRGKLKLEMLNAATRLADLTAPPSNRLERLHGSWNDFHSIRVNDQWRVVFRWVGGDAYDVRIIDYH